MHSTDVVIIGGGQAGLAVSYLLTQAGVDHVVLESGRVGERWHSQRWDSLRMLTPNWMNGLPGWPYSGGDRDGFSSAAEFARSLRAYATFFHAPVVEGSTVESVRRIDGRYRVVTADARWTATMVVVATGYCATPAVPRVAGALDSRIVQLTPDRYRSPREVPDGTVVVVGASATGVQLADELAAAGRDVVLSVGRHIRVPRRYRGRDILWWLESMGPSDRPGHHRGSSRLGPSLQLVGQAWREVDLPALMDRGVRPVGRLLTVKGRDFSFADDLRETAAAADSRLDRLLDRIDQYAVRAGWHGMVGRPERRTGSLGRLSAAAPTRLAGSRVRAVVWATGFRRGYPWLQVPVLDSSGEIVQHAGRTPAPGLFVLGLGGHAGYAASFIRGAGREAEQVVGHVLIRLGRTPLALEVA